MSLEQHYSIGDLSKIYRTSKDFWRKRVSNGEIKAIKLGRIIRIPEEEVLKVVTHLNSIGDIVDKILVDNSEFTDL